VNVELTKHDSVASLVKGRWTPAGPRRQGWGQPDSWHTSEVQAFPNPSLCLMETS
jgi:hypothetical protein